MLFNFLHGLDWKKYKEKYRQTVMIGQFAVCGFSVLQEAAVAVKEYGTGLYLSEWKDAVIYTSVLTINTLAAGPPTFIHITTVCLIKHWPATVGVCTQHGPCKLFSQRGTTLSVTWWQNRLLHTWTMQRKRTIVAHVLLCVYACVRAWVNVNTSSEHKHKHKAIVGLLQFYEEIHCPLHSLYLTNTQCLSSLINISHKDHTWSARVLKTCPNTIIYKEY